MTTIKWNDKEYKMPFDADYRRQNDDSFKEEIIVKNRFSGAPALLPWFAVAVYDTLMGADQLGDSTTKQKGLDWFSKYFTSKVGNKMITYFDMDKDGYRTAKGSWTVRY